jgi:predicted acetyltransferase
MIKLLKAGFDDVPLIHNMQIEAFRRLLDKYEDYDTNPGAETEDTLSKKMNQPTTAYYLILYNDRPIGALRVIDIGKGTHYRISPIFIIPNFQNMGIAQEVFKQLEQMKIPSKSWIIDTILEEPGNCHVYEKVGYKRTGKIDEVKAGMHIAYYEKELG